MISDKPERFGFPGLCVVSACVPGSPAHFSDQIMPGDCILQVNNVDVSRDNIVHTIRANGVPGKQIKLLVVRSGRKRPIAITLVSAPAKLVAENREIMENWAMIMPESD